MDQDFIQSGYFKTDFILFFSSAALNGFMMYSLTPSFLDSFIFSLFESEVTIINGVFFSSSSFCRIFNNSNPVIFGM